MDTVVLLQPHALSRRTLRQALLQAGVGHVLEAETAAEALRLLGSQLVSLVLTPWEAPDMAGRALVQALRNHGRNRQVPVAILDEGLAAPQVVATVKAGAAGRLQLPANVAAVRELLARLEEGASPAADTASERAAAEPAARKARRHRPHH